MDTILKKIEDLRERFLKAKSLLQIEKKQVQEKELRDQLAEPDIWENHDRAIKLGRRAEKLSKQTADWLSLEEEIRNAEELAALALREGGGDLTAELETKYAELAKKYEHLEFRSFLSGPYDNSPVFLSIHAGVGGVDAQDWAQMLERMYLRFSEREAWHIKIMDQIYGNEAGLKSATLYINGPWVYGYLKSENGVHRLLRNSPFNADGLRQTSFALVEVIPEIKSDAVVIKDDDLRIDVFRSSGPGGQSVNTTDSAVRVVYLPTGLTVTCQNERSQHQNKENALKILKTKLVNLALQDKEAKEKELKGGVTRAEWGQQIRSYFLYGRRLIKDHRSNYETSDVEAVLDGDLEKLIESYLRRTPKKNSEA